MNNPPPHAAYVHVPFCIHRCGYCDFTVIANRDDLLTTYLDCLEIEIERSISSPVPVDTLFIGGGTPNYLPPRELDRLLTLLQKWLPLNQGGEYSIECNPEDFTTDRIHILADHGINRVSLGVQSFQQSHLKTLERGHSPETVADVVARLRDLGFSNLSFDLIYAVPGQTLQEWESTLAAAIALKPDHLSTYGLTYEKGTSFWTRRLKHDLNPAEDELERSMYQAAMDRLPEFGFQQYELSNFAKTGFHCRHNQVYWNAKQYYGFGPGAASFIQGERATRHRSVTGWIKRIQTGQSPISATETLIPELARREAVMLGLRQIDGIDRFTYSKRFGCTIRDLEPTAYDHFLETGLLEETSTHVRLTYEGRFVADSVVSEFL